MKVHPMVGRTVTEVRPMTAAELDFEAWDVCPGALPPAVLVFDDGTRLYASRDPEGNGPGELFGVYGNGMSTRISARGG